MSAKAAHARMVPPVLSQVLPIPPSVLMPISVLAPLDLRMACAHTTFVSQVLLQCTVEDSNADVALGGNCDIDVDECDSNPCQNNAVCVESTTDASVSYHAYQCQCAAGFADGMCNYEPISAYASSCGVLESSASSTTSGSCAIDVNECDSNPCENGAVCSESSTDAGIPFNSYRCTCSPGFADGVCAYDYIGEYVLECQVMNSHSDTSFAGNCGIDVDECASSPCQNNAACTESRADATISLHAYQCACASGFANGLCAYAFISEYTTECSVLESVAAVTQSGNCDMDVDECLSAPCHNQAICHDHDDAWECECVDVTNPRTGLREGFEGEFCEHKIDVCSVLKTTVIQSPLAATMSVRGTTTAPAMLDGSVTGILVAMSTSAAATLARMGPHASSPRVQLVASPKVHRATPSRKACLGWTATVANAQQDTQMACVSMVGTRHLSLRSCTGLRARCQLGVTVTLT